MTYSKTYNPCDDCPHSFSKNNQESNVCKICEFKQALDLINHQKAEIEDLKEAKEKAAATAMGVIKRQDAENKQLLTRLTRFNEEIAQPYILINTDAELTAEMKEALRTQKPAFVPDDEGTVIRIDKASIRAAAVKEVIARVKEYFNPDISFEFRKWLDSLEKELVGEG